MPKNCQRCGEPLTDSVMYPTDDMHRECIVREILGSVACQMKLCKRHDGPGCGDDPKLTKRQAAVAAMEYARNQMERTDPNGN